MAAAMPQKTGNASYTFASQPRALGGTRKKYRDPLTETMQSQSTTYNIMHDPRVIRGNTYRQQTMTQTMTDPLELQRQQETLRRQQARKRAKAKARARSPEPVAGRQHMEVQTELYLEELTDRVEEKDVEVQTDAFLDRPPSPLFIPAKSGLDAATQIEEGDLFDFEVEVKPILEVLVGKTLEQALMEVMEEEELAQLRDHQREFEELRNAELIETQRLEESARRHREEKERRMKQQREVALQQKATADKIAARAFAQTYLADLVPSVFGSLQEGGYFYDTQEREIETQFMPWLMERVSAQIQQLDLSRQLLDDIIMAVVKERQQAYGGDEAPPAKEPQQEPKQPQPEESEEQEQESSEQAAEEASEGDEGGDGESQPKDEGATEQASEDAAEDTPAAADDDDAPQDKDGDDGGDGGDDGDDGAAEDAAGDSAPAAEDDTAAADEQQGEEPAADDEAPAE